MLGFPIPKLVLLALLSTQTYAFVVPKEEFETQPPVGLRDIIEDYSSKVSLQQLSLEDLTYQLLESSEPSSKKIAEAASALLESQYGRTGPRERLVEFIPADTAMTTESLEYVVSVASRYTENVIHAAREIKKSPFRKSCTLDALKYLKAEKEKSDLFDELLLGLLKLQLQAGKEENLTYEQNPETNAMTSDYLYEETTEFSDSTQTEFGDDKAIEDYDNKASAVAQSSNWEAELKTTQIEEIEETVVYRSVSISSRIAL